MQPELVPYPIPPHELPLLAVELNRVIDKFGVEKVVDRRIKFLSAKVDQANLNARLLQLTAFAFSDSQIRRLIRREMWQIAGNRAALRAKRLSKKAQGKNG